jgi:hypothetical protein
VADRAAKTKEEEHRPSDTVAAGTQAIADQFSSYKQQQHRQHIANVALQGITICLVFGTAGIALWQGFISRWQLSEMHDAGLDTKKLAEAANKSAEATVRLSTNNRAWVILLYDGRLDIIISDPTQRTIVPRVHFALHNYGNSPAIIKSVEPHMFYIPLGNPTQVFPERPTGELDPRSPSDRRWRETSIWTRAAICSRSRPASASELLNSVDSRVHPLRHARVPLLPTAAGLPRPEAGLHRAAGDLQGSPTAPGPADQGRCHSRTLGRGTALAGARYQRRGRGGLPTFADLLANG